MFRAMLSVGAGRSIEARSGTESRARGCRKARKAQNRESARFVVPCRRRISRIRPTSRDMYRIFLTQGGNIPFHMCLTQRARASSRGGTHGKGVNVLWSGPLPPHCNILPNLYASRPGRRKLGQKHKACPLPGRDTVDNTETHWRKDTLSMPSRVETGLSLIKPGGKAQNIFPPLARNSSRMFAPRLRFFCPRERASSEAV